jgi:hypothetical protein
MDFLNGVILAGVGGSAMAPEGCCLIKRVLAIEKRHVEIGHSPPMECRAQCRQSIAGRESGVAGSNSHVYKTTSNTDIQQHLNTEVQIPTFTADEGDQIKLQSIIIRASKLRCTCVSSRTNQLNHLLYWKSGTESNKRDPSVGWLTQRYADVLAHWVIH